MRTIGLLGFAVLALLGLAGCGGGGASPNTPLSQLTQADNNLQSDGQTLLDEGVAAFQDLMPQGLTPQATGNPRPLTMTKDEEGNVVLIGGPWRPPFPWPLPPLDKPLFLVIKQPSCPGGCKPQAYMGFLRQTRDGQYIMEWQGARGAAPVRVTAQVEQQGDFGASGKYVVKFSVQLIPPTIDIIIMKMPDVPMNPVSRMHIVSTLPPDTLQGRPLNGNLNPNRYEARFKEICCGMPKPYPPLWPPIWLHREDLSAVVVPYDNPQLRTATTIEELLDKDLGFIYVRKKPWPGPTTDCGPNRVWCPDDQVPFYNMRLVGEGRPVGGSSPHISPNGFHMLRNPPGDVVATLPVEVTLSDEPGNLGISDTLGDQLVLNIKLPRIKITTPIEWK